MRFEQTRVALEPRTAANCLDLAFVFCGRHWGPLAGLWGLFSVPLGLTTWFAARETNWGFLTAVACFVFGTGPFGAMLAAGAARTTFGEEFTLRKLLSDLRTDWPLIVQVVGMRMLLAMTSVLCVVPAAFLAVRWGFAAKSRVLTRLHEQRHDRRTNELVRLEFADLVVRGGVLVVFGGMFWLIAELTADAAWTILFGQSLFFGRLSEVGSIIGGEQIDESDFERVAALALDDPAVLILHLATGLATYAVCRIAWFFCYIDLRVRRDCWDLELELLREAERIATSGGLFEVAQSPPRAKRAVRAGVEALLVWLALGATTTTAAGQDSAPHADIRAEAKRILADPEFRYFEHLNESAERPAARGRASGGPVFGGGTGDGSARDGERRSSSEGRGSSQGRPRSTSNSEREGESSSTPVPFGRGLGAIGSAVALVFHALAYLMLIAVCGLIVFLIVQAFLNHSPKAGAGSLPALDFDVSPEDDHSPGELPADAYLARARELARRQRYREALAQLLLGGMSSIERGGLIRHRRGLTLRDYLRALRGKEGAFDGFRTMIGLYEPVAFGRRVASDQTFHDALSAYEQAVQAPT
jgi:hypothetical protein